MTRVNVGIPPAQLPTKLLIAEHREIKRLPNHLRKYGFNYEKLPPKFTLGSGHVIFMLSKGRYTYKRYIQLHKECLKRGFKVGYYGLAWSIYGSIKYMHLFKDFKPSKRDKQIILKRFKERGFKLLTQ